MKKIIRKILYIFGLEAIGRILLQQSALKEDGWFKSVKTKQAVDKNGEPIPWLTYPFIDFIDDRINNSLEIFEFGAGNSSIYWARKAKSVISIEHSPEWFKIIKANDKFKYENLDIRLVEIPEDLKKKGYHVMAFTNHENKYVHSLRDLNRKFDVVVVDGLFRNSCILNSLASLKPGGVIFLDNTSRIYEKDLKLGTDFLAENGFRRIDFRGVGPIYSTKSSTTVFYKDNNCLGI
jgi:precorrin-6B methylase 2